ncbi:MAG: YpdA family putative bacillithiol disulfide reductase [Acidobacteriia bacterium]|nr:YpdA family putative bacillithiol disulfide reductase [Terriglobia bacterium]
MDEKLEVVVVGAGPTGLACAIEAAKENLKALVIEKGCLVNSIFHYPTEMIFFTSRELLEIGNIPMPSISVKPNRAEALEYYRRVAEFFRLPIHFYERVMAVSGSDGRFQVLTQRDGGRRHGYETRKVILATGYYDLPNLLEIPGENLPKVSHYYTSPHPFFQQKVAVIGGANSAADAALDLCRHGVEVTLIHHERELGRNIKYWVRPDVENRIKEGSIRALFETVVREIGEDWIRVETKAGETWQLENDFVFALTGYHPDFDFIKSTGVTLDPETCRPVCNAQTLESNVPGIYLAGVIIAGYETNEIFIENGRFHGKQIIADIRKKA